MPAIGPNAIPAYGLTDGSFTTDLETLREKELRIKNARRCDDELFDRLAASIYEEGAKNNVIGQVIDSKTGRYRKVKR